MEKRFWKTLAIILIAIMVLWLALGFWEVYDENKNNQRSTICYYDVCGEYPDAAYYSDTKVCACYDYDVLGSLVVSKYEVID